MSLAQYAPSPPNSLDRPPCPKCGAKVMLTRIDPHAPGIELRLFECVTCDYAETNLVNFN